MKGYCEICGKEIEVAMCCSGRECGCMGQPIDPPACSEECYIKLMAKYGRKSNMDMIKDKNGNELKEGDDVKVGDLEFKIEQFQNMKTGETLACSDYGCIGVQLLEKY